MTVPYQYSMWAIPTPEITPKQKQDAVHKALKGLTKKPMRNPEDPKYPSDAFFISEYRSYGFGFPVGWKIMGSMFEGVTSRGSDRTPDVHYSCDDGLGCASKINFPVSVPHVTPSWFSRDFIPVVAPAFDAYRFDLLPRSVVVDDREKNMSRMKMYRWDIIGVATVSFYDDRICQSTFGLSAEAVSQRIAGLVPYTNVIRLRNRNGVVIQVSDLFITGEELTPIRGLITKALCG